MDERDYSYAVERALGRILRRFDEEDKEELAVELFEALGLAEDGRRFSDQVAALLGRDLSAAEAFRLDALQQAFEQADYFEE